MRNEIVLYRPNELAEHIEVRLEDETVWLTQAQMAELFQTSPQNITIHIRNIFQESELEKEGTCKDYLQVQNEGGRKVKRKIQLYNLDAILSVGYRVNSKQGTQFRIWATATLKGNIIKDYTMDVKRLRNQSKISAIPLIIERLNIILRIISEKLGLEIDFVEKGKC